MNIKAEYIWLDGNVTKELRCKTRILILENKSTIDLSFFPEWGFDGSSTYQAKGMNSDLTLKPVKFIKDPIRGKNNYLVLSEVYNIDGTPHKSNSRYELRKEIELDNFLNLDPWIGFEQEFTLFRNSRPCGWPLNGFPEAQGPFYCGVGSNKTNGREIIEEHIQACLDANIMIFGSNAEVMLGQWEFQIGYRGISSEDASPLNISDQLWIARWLLIIIAEKYNIVVSFDNKPISGDWNGAGNHTNFSTNKTRDKINGWNAIKKLVLKLSERHEEHISVYGENLNKRLTGLHETCNIDTFKYGERDRSASIRIPDIVSKKRYGYIEDRRPGANCDPYVVSKELVKTAKLS
jgi:glutamine synthetase